MFNGAVLLFDIKNHSQNSYNIFTLLNKFYHNVTLLSRLDVFMIVVICFELQLLLVKFSRFYNKR